MISLLKSTFNTRYLKVSCTKSFLIRSDKIDDCSEDDIEFLLSVGIKNVIDLRDLSNKKTNPNLSKYGIKLLNSPMNVSKLRKEFLKKFPNGNCFDFYVFLLTQYNRIKDFFEKLVLTEGGVLFCCSAGRDRTGIIAFLIELISGADKNYIVEDMSVSDLNLAKRNNVTNMELASNLNYDKAKTRALKLYNWFFESYSSVDGYLGKIGFDSNGISDIKIRINELLSNN